MLEYVASLRNYIMYYDTNKGNYKIHNGFKIVSNPSTEEDAYRKLRFLTRKGEYSDFKRCSDDCGSALACSDCEKY